MKFLKLKKSKTEIENKPFSIKENYLEVDNDFKTSDLKPYQRLITLNDDGIQKRYLIDFALVNSEVNRLNKKDIQSRSNELKTDKPFRMIAQHDIDLGQGKFSYEYAISANEESTILGDLQNTNLFDHPKKNNINNSNTKPTVLNSENDNKNEKSFLKFRNKNAKTDESVNDKLSAIDILDNEIIVSDVDASKETYEENFEAIQNQDPINLELKNKYEKNLIFDDNDPIEVNEGEKRTIILPFKLREVNDEWKKNDSTFFRSAPKGKYKWFANYIEESFLKSLEDSYNGTLSSPFLETYEPLPIIDFGPDDLIDQNILSSTNNSSFVKHDMNFANNVYATNGDIIENSLNNSSINGSNDNPSRINEIKYFDVDESYKNDGLNSPDDNNEQYMSDILHNDIEVNFDKNMLESNSLGSTDYNNDLFFKNESNESVSDEISDSNIRPNKKIYSKFGKEVKDSKYEKIRLPKLNNMIIVRKKIDKKLIKERARN